MCMAAVIVFSVPKSARNNKGHPIDQNHKYKNKYK